MRLLAREKRGAESSRHTVPTASSSDIRGVHGCGTLRLRVSSSIPGTTPRGLVGPSALRAQGLTANGRCTHGRGYPENDAGVAGGISVRSSGLLVPEITVCETRATRGGFSSRSSHTPRTPRDLAKAMDAEERNPSNDPCWEVQLERERWGGAGGSKQYSTLVWLVKNREGKSFGELWRSFEVTRNLHKSNQLS